ncbi:class I SAM-dependent methyltransferase [Acidisoma sp. 7E03]
MRYVRVAAIEEAYFKVEIDKTVSPRDHMYNSGPDWYFSVGVDAIRAVFRALATSAMAEPKRILDLPCGHGRVARHLRAAFPNAAITFADIDTDGADFCAAQFAGMALHSQPDLTQVDLGAPYDLIWIGSLFTHVDASRATAWLAHLCRSLNRHGVVIATLHGQWSREVQRSYGAMIGDREWQRMLAGCEASGWGYAPYPDTPDYGVSLVKASTAVAMASTIEGVRILGYMERGWAGNHDVLMLTAWDRMEPW